MSKKKGNVNNALDANISDLVQKNEYLVQAVDNLTKQVNLILKKQSETDEHLVKVDNLTEKVDLFLRNQTKNRDTRTENNRNENASDSENVGAQKKLDSSWKEKANDYVAQYGSKMQKMPFQVNFRNCHAKLLAKLIEKYKSDVQGSDSSEELKWLEDKINEQRHYRNEENEKKKAALKSKLEDKRGTICVEFQEKLIKEETGEQSWVKIAEQEEEELKRDLGDDAVANEPYKSYLDELRRELEKTYCDYEKQKQEKFLGIRKTITKTITNVLSSMTSQDKS